MKVQCPECRDIVEMTRFTTSAEGLRFRCDSCLSICYIPNADSLDQAQNQTAHSTASIEPQTPAHLTDSPSTQSTPLPAKQLCLICPKCGHAQTAGDNCNRCGLSFSKFDPANLPPDPQEAAQIWQEILSQPTDRELHERFISVCSAQNRLDYATRQYRIFRNQGGPETIIANMQTKIVGLAQAQLAPIERQHGFGSNPKRKGKIILFILVMMCVAGVGYLFYYFIDIMGQLN